MQKKTLSSFVFIFLSTCLFAQYPDLSKYTVVNTGNTAFNYACGGLSGWLQGCSWQADAMAMEVPPWIIGGSGSWRTYFMNDGKGSFACSAPYDIISNNTINIKDDGTGPVQTSVSQAANPVGGCLAPRPVSGDLTLSTPQTGIERALSSITLANGFIADPASGDLVAEIVNGLSGGDDWKRNYYGIYSAHYFDHPTAGPVSLGFLHGENRNPCDGSCLNTINADDRYGCTDGNNWNSYNGIISAAWISNTQATNFGQQRFTNELGPIAWPSTGYVTTTGIKATIGLRHPSSFIYNNYVYVFYVDGGPYLNHVPGSAGRYHGIKMVRAPLSGALDPGSYQVYYRDANGNDSWSPSLPPGFTKENMDGFWNVQGSPSTDLMDDNGTTSQEIRFSVAHVNNTSYFIGVEEYINNSNNTNNIAIRFSSDLMHWTGRESIINSAANWDAGSMHYPIFLRKDGWSNSEIDANDFYVLGTNSTIQNLVNKVHVYLPSPMPMAKSTTLTTGLASNLAEAGTGIITGTGILPNPNQGVFQLGYTLSGNARVQINVLDASGRLLFAGTPVSRAPGHYLENIDISSRAKGIFLVELLVDGSRTIYKAVYY